MTTMVKWCFDRIDIRYPFYLDPSLILTAMQMLECRSMLRKLTRKNPLAPIERRVIYSYTVCRVVLPRMRELVLHLQPHANIHADQLLD